MAKSRNQACKIEDENGPRIANPVMLVRGVDKGHAKEGPFKYSQGPV
jgi:hypothetical protein